MEQLQCQRVPKPPRGSSSSSSSSTGWSLSGYEGACWTRGSCSQRGRTGCSLALPPSGNGTRGASLASLAYSLKKRSSVPIITDGRTIVASGNTSSTAFSPNACRKQGLNYVGKRRMQEVEPTPILGYFQPGHHAVAHCNHDPLVGACHRRLRPRAASRSACRVRPWSVIAATGRPLMRPGS